MTYCRHDLPEGTCADCNGTARPQLERDGAVITSRYRSTCAAPGCVYPIEPGDDIVMLTDVRGDAYGWAHAGDSI